MYSFQSLQLLFFNFSNGKVITKISNKKDLTLEIENNGRKLEKLSADKSHREKDIESFDNIEKERTDYHGMVEDLQQVENNAYKT